MCSSKQIFSSSCELLNICHDVILENVGSSDRYVMDSKVGKLEEHHIHIIFHKIFCFTLFNSSLVFKYAIHSMTRYLFDIFYSSRKGNELDLLFFCLLREFCL